MMTYRDHEPCVETTELRICETFDLSEFLFLLAKETYEKEIEIRNSITRKAYMTFFGCLSVGCMSCFLYQMFVSIGAASNMLFQKACIFNVLFYCIIGCMVSLEATRSRKSLMYQDMIYTKKYVADNKDLFRTRDQRYLYFVNLYSEMQMSVKGCNNARQKWAGVGRALLAVSLFSMVIWVTLTLFTG